MPPSLDADAAAYLDLRRRDSAMSPGTALDPRALRAEERTLRSRYGHGPRMHSEAQISGTGIVPRHVVLEPTPHPRGELLYIHGGGWVMGEPEDYLAVCRELAHASGWRIVATDYRKAPEHPFPAALDDCRAVARQRQARAASEGIPFGVAGDSAGGNLAAVIAAGFAAEQPSALAVQVLITPVLDSDLDTPSYLDPDAQLTLTRDTMAWFWDQYVPHDSRIDERVAPLRSPHVAGLPLTIFVSVGTDVLRSEGESYRERLTAAGVAVRHREFPGQMHGFFQLRNVMPASAEAVAWIADELRTVGPAHAEPHTPTHTGGRP